MSIEVTDDKVVLNTELRTDIVDIWGEDVEKYLQACQAHMVDAISTELTLQQRFHCLGCMHSRLVVDFFPWLNEEGYTYVIEDFDYPIFLSHVVRWAQGWAQEQLLSPCTDGMDSKEIH
jgi:hypothetical protein